MNKEVADRLLKNYHNARKSYEAWCFLENIDLEKNNSSIRSYVDNNPLLHYLRYLALKDVHVSFPKNRTVLN